MRRIAVECEFKDEVHRPRRGNIVLTADFAGISTAPEAFFENPGY
jgi:hypothetical protein